MPPKDSHWMSHNGTGVSGNDLPRSLIRECPDTCETEIAFRRGTGETANQMDLYGNDRHVFVGLHALIGRRQFGDLYQAGFVGVEVGLFSEDLPEVAGEDQLRSQQPIQSGHVGIEHCLPEAFFGFEDLLHHCVVHSISSCDGTQVETVLSWP